MKKILIKGLVIFFLLQAQTAFAGTGLFFNITTVGALLNIRTNVPTHPDPYHNASIRFTTPGYRVVGCTRPAPDNACLFEVGNTMPASILVDGPRGTANVILCLQGKEPLTCQNYQVTLTGSGAASRFAFIGDNGVEALHTCTIDLATGVITGCTDFSFAGFDEFPLDVAFNAAGTFAYISTINNAGPPSHVYLCNVDPATGTLSNCAITGNGFDFGNFLPAVTLSPDGRFAYVSSLSLNNVVKCDVNQATGALSNCAETLAPFFNDPFGITFSSAGNFAYIGNGAGGADFVTLCSVNPGDGELTSCFFGTFGLSSPTWVALSPSGTTAYVVNSGNSTLSQCQVNPATGAIFLCKPTGDFAFAGPLSIAINPTGTTVYVTDNGGSRVVKCSVNGVTGALSGCVVTGPGLPGPYGITLYG